MDEKYHLNSEGAAAGSADAGRGRRVGAPADNTDLSPEKVAKRTVEYFGL
jgi:hypothetical protein